LKTRASNCDQRKDGEEKKGSSKIYKINENHVRLIFGEITEKKIQKEKEKCYIIELIKKLSPFFCISKMREIENF